MPVLTFACACNDSNDKTSNLANNPVDTLKNVKEKVQKQDDTVFIKHDKDWTSEDLNYTTDTIVFRSGMRRNILTGTTILPSSHNQYNAEWEYGLYFSKITKTDCQKSAEEYEATGGIRQAKINSITSTDSTLTIDINISDNCCYDFLCDISIVEDSIINLITIGYGTHCDCDCCYGLVFNLTKEEDPKYKKMKSVMINGDRKTLKQIY